MSHHMAFGDCPEMALSINRRSFVGVLTVRALLFRVYVEVPEFWKLPNGYDTGP